MLWSLLDHQDAQFSPINSHSKRPKLQAGTDAEIKLVLWGALLLHKKRSGLWLLYSNLSEQVLSTILRLPFSWSDKQPSPPTPQNDSQKEIRVHSFWEGQKSVLKVLCKTAYTLTQEKKNNESLVTIKLHEEIAHPPENRETWSFWDSNTAAVIHHCMICYFSPSSWLEGWSSAPQQTDGSPTELKKGI